MPGPAADIPYRDEVGEMFDFHALRHTAITWVSRKAHPKALQTFARHHSAAFTFDRCAHVAHVDMEEGLSALPPVPGQEAAAAAATGTAHVTEKDMRRHSVTPGGTTTRGEKHRADRPKSEADGGKAGDDAASGIARVRGLESPAFGSTIRTPSNSSPNPGGTCEGGAAPHALGHAPAPSDAALACLLALWPELPGEVRDALVRLAMAARGSR